ncbi:MAG: JAB domain-containing protein [Candidatus Sedimenticola sp. (ex Thyasira tokunagai)]
MKAQEFLSSGGLTNPKLSAEDFLQDKKQSRPPPKSKTQATPTINNETGKLIVSAPGGSQSGVSQETAMPVMTALPPTWWDRFSSSFKRHENVSQNLIDLAADKRPTIDSATGEWESEEVRRERRLAFERRRDNREYVPPAEGVKELSAEFLGSMAKETADPLAIITGGIGATANGTARILKLMGLGGGYEAAAGVVEQVSDKGEVYDPEAVAVRAAAGAALTPALDALFRGVGAGIRKLREQLKKPGTDKTAIEAEIATQIETMERHAAEAGMEPEEAASRILEYSGGPGETVAAPKSELLDSLPGQDIQPRTVDSIPEREILSPGEQPTTVPQEALYLPAPSEEAVLRSAGGSSDTLTIYSKEGAGESVGPDSTLGRRVKHVTTDVYPTGISRVESSGDLAHLVAPLRKNAQESALAVVTDEAGDVLRIAHMAKGSQTEAHFDIGAVAGAITSTPGAKRAWFAHNHPDGSTSPSDADVNVTARLMSLLEGSGVDLKGSVVVGPGGKAHSSIDDNGMLTMNVPTTAAPRTGTQAVTERKLFGTESTHDPLTSAEASHAALTRFGGDKEGVLLLDGERRPLKWLAMTADEMRTLRSGEKGGSNQLLSALDETQAESFLVRSGSTPAIANMNAFAKAANRELYDAIDFAGRSARQVTGDNMPSQSTFYSNPFLEGAKDLARDIGMNPGRNTAAAGTGAVFGATTSDAEMGSAQWWNDVAFAAGAGVTVGQVVRRTRLLGKGSIVDNALSKTGDWIESLPFIGRGPSGVRELKRKQRLMQQLLDQQTEETGRHLLKNFTPAERAQIADLIETKGIVKDLNVIHRQAEALDNFVSHAAERMKALGMLPEEMEAGGYLHRYYAKHLGLDKLFGQAKKQQGLAGSYTIARGTDDVFHASSFSPGAREAIAAAGDNKELLRATELVEFTGMQDGKLRSFLFTHDEVPRVETSPGARPILAQKDKPDLLGVLDDGPVRHLEPTGRTWNPKGQRGEDLLLHRDWTEAERLAWGEIKDAGYRYVRGMTEVSHDLSLATMFDEVSRRPQWARAEPDITGGKTWMQVPDARIHKNSPLKRYGNLAGMYVRQDVWNGIKNYGRAPFAPGNAGKIYRGVLNRWKLYKTVYNPVTHMNNTWSNVELLMMADYSAKDLAAGLGHMRQGDKSALWREARDNGLFGTDWGTSILKVDEGAGNQALADLAEALRNQPDIPDAPVVVDAFMRFKEWWISSKNAIAEGDGALQTGGALTKAMSAPVIKGIKAIKKPVDLAARAAQRAYKFEDEAFKMAVFAAERSKGTEPSKAVEAAQGFFFDYQDLPEAVKWVRDFPVGSPFVSYTYFAIPAVAKSAVRNPEKVLALVAAYEAWNYAAMTSEDEEGGGVAPGEYWATVDAESTVSPPWERGRALWGGLNTIHMPSPEGYRIALGRAHALGNPFMSEAGGREKLPTAPGLANFWGSSAFGSSPFHSLLDVAVNEDWKGKPIYAPGAPDDEKAKRAAAYLYQAWAPSNPLVPGGYHQQRIMEGLANDVREARASGEDPGLITPLVDSANGVAEALGLEGFTGLDRADNEINTRDSVLSAFGVKLRPIRFDQSIDFELSRIGRDRKETEGWFKRQAKNAGEGRITDEQLSGALDGLDRKGEDYAKQEDKIFNAEEFLRGQGRLR